MLPINMKRNSSKSFQVERNILIRARWLVPHSQSQSIEILNRDPLNAALHMLLKEVLTKNGKWQLEWMLTSLPIHATLPDQVAQHTSFLKATKSVLLVAVLSITVCYKTSPEICNHISVNIKIVVYWPIYEIEYWAIYEIFQKSFFDRYKSEFIIFWAIYENFYFYLIDYFGLLHPSWIDENFIYRSI